MTFPTYEPGYVWKEWHACFKCIQGFAHCHELTTHMKTHLSGYFLSQSHKGNIGCASSKQKVTLDNIVGKMDYQKRPDHKNAICTPSNQKVLRTDGQGVRNASGKPHQCPICGIRFRHIAVFQQHLNLHKTSEIEEPSEHDTKLITPKESETMYIGERSGSISSQEDWTNNVIPNDDGLKKFSECASDTLTPPIVDPHIIVPFSYNGCKELNVATVCQIGELKLQIIPGAPEAESSKRYPDSDVSEIAEAELPKMMCEVAGLQSKSTDKLQYGATCVLCAEVFADDQDFRDHMMMHDDYSQEKTLDAVQRTRKKPTKEYTGEHSKYQCPLCKKEFANPKSLRAHKRVHAGIRFMCPICKKGLTRKYDMERHVRTIHNRESQSGVVENESLPAENTREAVEESSQLLNESLMTQQGENVLMSKYELHQSSPEGDIGSRIIEEQSIIIESHDDESKGIIIDDEEPESFSECTPDTLNPHTTSPLGNKGLSESEIPRINQPYDPQTSSGEKSHKCSLCDIAFSHADQLDLHMVTHTGEKHHTCSICDTRFSHSDELHEHMDSHSGEKCCNCDVCGMIFARSDDLIQHMRTHPVETLYSCSLCNKVLSNAEELDLHKATHSEERYYKCPICCMRCDHPTTLDRHMVTHRGAKSHQCPICGKQFSQKAYVKTHMLTHTGEKPHKCTICGRGFAQKSSRKTHMRVHNSDLPYKCFECGNRYSQKNSLEVHMLSHSEGTPNKCSVCDQRFTVPGELQQHMMEHAIVID